MSPGAPGVWDSEYHAPVLVDEIRELFRGSKDVLDCTLGGGGHSAALLALGAQVTAIDRDPEAVSEARLRLAADEAAGRFRVILGNFADIDTLLPDKTIKFDGILADLGVSSHQIDDAGRGFSFREGAPLDMRMEPGATSAAELLAQAEDIDKSEDARYGKDSRGDELPEQLRRSRLMSAGAFQSRLNEMDFEQSHLFVQIDAAPQVDRSNCFERFDLLGDRHHDFFQYFQFMFEDGCFFGFPVRQAFQSGYIALQIADYFLHIETTSLVLTLYTA